jgi:hypothetical protein
MTPNLIENEGVPEARPRHDIRITVDYLPSPKPFHHDYLHNTTVGVVQKDAMEFFGVRDHQDRDKHQFFLEYHHQRLSHPDETLHHLLGDKTEADFHLVEQITPGHPLP